MKKTNKKKFIEFTQKCVCLYVNAIYNTDNNNKMYVSDKIGIRERLAHFEKLAALECKRNTQHRKLTNKKILFNLINVCQYFKFDCGKMNARRCIEYITIYNNNFIFNVDIVKVISLLMNKMINYGKSASICDTIRNKIIDIYTNIKIEPKQDKTQDESGFGHNTLVFGNEKAKQFRHDYHCAPKSGDKEQATSGKQENETLLGFEWEGAFKDNKSFIDFCAAARELEFEGGRLYDERNFFMPTFDNSIKGGYTVEFGFCPMSRLFAEKFFSTFEKLAFEYGFESSTEINHSGTHCHIDSKLFNQNTLKNLFNIVYGESDADKLARYKRQNDIYANGNIETALRYINNYEPHSKTPSGEQLYINNRKIRANGRYGLINLQNTHFLDYNEQKDINDITSGTIELRGFNGCVSPSQCIKQINDIVNKALTI